MSKHMNKRTRTLLYASIALVAVVGLLCALLFLLPEEEEEPSGDDTVDESVVVFDKSKEDDVTVTSATFSLLGITHTIKAGEGDLYTLDGYDDMPLDYSGLSDTAESLLTVTATRLVTESPENPSDFGFDQEEGNRTVSAAYSDNSTLAFEIGNLIPSKEGYYFRITGKDAVYVMDTDFCETMTQPITSYISHAPITAPETEKDSDTVVVRDVTLTGSVRPSTLYFQVTEQPKEGEDSMVLSGYAIQKPYFHAVDSNSKLISYSTFTTLSAYDIAKLRPTAADLKTYGITAPYSVCTVNLSLQRTTETTDKDGETTQSISYHNTFKYTITLGKTDKNGNYYGVVYAEDKLLPVVYLFSPTAVAEWVDAQYEDVADNLLYFQYITNLESMTITADGDKKVYALEHFPDAEDRDDQLKVTADGKTYSTPDFRTLYGNLLGLYRTGAAIGKPSGSPMLSVYFKPFAKYGDALRIDIYEYDAGQCYARHSTGETHMINAKDVQEWMNDYNKFLAGTSLS